MSIVLELSRHKAASRRHIPLCRNAHAARKNNSESLKGGQEAGETLGEILEQSFHTDVNWTGLCRIGRIVSSHYQSKLRTFHISSTLFGSLLRLPFSPARSDSLNPPQTESSHCLLLWLPLALGASFVLGKQRQLPSRDRESQTFTQATSSGSGSCFFCFCFFSVP